MNFSGALKLVKYQLFSRHGKGHGIHSPFVFMLISNVFRNKIDPHIVFTIESIRRKNLSDNRTIDVLDLGAGSSRMKDNSRKVSDIARYSSVPGKYGILLASMAAEFGKQTIVEFGTSLGISTMYLASGCPEAVVYTMEGCPETAHIARENFRESGLENIRLMNGSFDGLMPEINDLDKHPGLVFIDGDHREEPLMKYFSTMSEIAGEDTVIIIDDIHSSGEMDRAWEKIKEHKNVSFTVDIFRMGMVFFRKGINHINYIIRY
ncbi:MAG: class I SAM-dependent methyltransferase [Bacteroidia bacterium]|nr:class I SAM-dependent methyltransferase [Bacteroidia bacterium]